MLLNFLRADFCCCFHFKYMTKDSDLIFFCNVQICVHFFLKSFEGRFVFIKGELQACNLHLFRNTTF